MTGRPNDMKKPRVAIYMGSASDAPIMEEALKTLRELGVECEMAVASAHRSYRAGTSGK